MLEELAQSDDIYSVLGTVPPHQQPRCLTPSEDLIQPPPIASSSPITQVTPNNNGTTQQPQQPWKRDRSALRLSSSPFNEMRRTVTMVWVWKIKGKTSFIMFSGCCPIWYKAITRLNEWSPFKLSFSQYSLFTLFTVCSGEYFSYIVFFSTRFNSHFSMVFILLFFPHFKQARNHRGK
jgi:hypothetical protein